MKKQISKLSLKTDKIVSLSKTDAQCVVGGAKPDTKKCWSYAPTCSADASAPCCTWQDTLQFLFNRPFLDKEGGFVFNLPQTFQLTAEFGTEVEDVKDIRTSDWFFLRA